MTTKPTWILTPEEIDLVYLSLPDLPTDEEMALEGGLQVASAQAKKIKEWGNEPCLHRGVIVFEGHGHKKRECSQCWTELGKEVGE